MFPFHLLIDRQLKIRSSGKSLQVIREIEFGADFFSLFTISRPRLLDLQSVDLASLKGQLVILEFLSTQEKIYPKGTNRLFRERSIFPIYWFALVFIYG